jgi:hypothetical protein
VKIMRSVDLNKAIKSDEVGFPFAFCGRSFRHFQSTFLSQFCDKSEAYIKSAFKRVEIDRFHKPKQVQSGSPKTKIYGVVVCDKNHELYKPDEWL